MRVLFFLGLVVLILPLTAKAQEEESLEWKTCKQDSDCVVVGMGCSIDVANMQFQSVADEYHKKRNDERDCEIDDKPHFASCVRDKGPCVGPSGRVDNSSICENASGHCVLE